jgi:hypothetical protein
LLTLYGDWFFSENGFSNSTDQEFCCSGETDILSSSELCPLVDVPAKKILGFFLEASIVARGKLDLVETGEWAELTCDL